jgi:hypothetical protein
VANGVQVGDVEIPYQTYKELKGFLSLEGWDNGFLPYLRAILERNRTRLEAEDLADDEFSEVRGECRRIRRLLTLRQDLPQK